VIDYQYFYLFGDLVIFLPIWVILFLLRRDLHKELIISGLFGALAAAISEPFFLMDYWRPPYFFYFPIGFGLEDLIFNFLCAGIAAVLYEFILGKHLSRRRDHHHHWILISIISIIVLISTFIAINIGSSINSIYVLFMMLLLWSLVLLFYRHDLLKDALLSAVFFAFFYFFAFLIILKIYPEAVTRFWLLKNLSGIFILGIPIEELLFAFFTGLAVGPFYEFMCGLKIKDRN